MILLNINPIALLVTISILAINTLIFSFLKRKVDTKFTIAYGILWLVFITILDIRFKFIRGQLAYTILTFSLAILFLIAFLRKVKENVDERFRIVLRNGFEIKDILRGVFIGGSSGSGKTRGVFYNLIEFFGNNKWASIAFCYKVDDMLEYILANYNFEMIDVFSPLQPDITCKVNPLDPKYIIDESDIEAVWKDLIEANDMTSQKSSAGVHFNNLAVGVLTGISWILYENNPEYLTLPRVASIYQSLSSEDLENFLSTNMRARVKASGFFNLGGGNVYGSLHSTITNVTGIFMSPRVCFSMDDPFGNYVDLKVNRPDNPRVLALQNVEGKEDVCIPILNVVMFRAIKLLTHGINKEEDKYPTALLVDEASQINLKNFWNIPALVRVKLCTTILGIQDFSLAYTRVGKDAFSAIISNLSTFFMGKVNNAETGKYYEDISVLEDKKRTSYTSGAGLFGSNRSTNVSTEEKKKYRVSDFYKLQKGEFIASADGNWQKLYWDLSKNIKKEYYPKFRPDISNEELSKYYTDLLQWGGAYVLEYFAHPRRLN